ncbi:hypothetical protein AVEN_144038-1 [Araneus ventricosus]|uniref:Uncharacterized protein n=1 Tax=Araneus ventricosus TaxID=182803 RepID=A0A4Y2DGA1_ARAVE|nr:hypothetical protein AVEN_144038-1 [Araneus ventricosus]
MALCQIFVFSGSISIAFGTVLSKFIISAVSGVVITASTGWSGELALFRISSVSIGLACQVSLDVKRIPSFGAWLEFIGIFLQLSDVEEGFLKDPRAQ